MRLLLLLLLVFAISCGTREPKSSGGPVKEFEGVITYKITYVNRPQAMQSGDTMRIIYSKGNLIKLYNSTQKGALKKDVFFVSNNGYYTVLNGMDSVYSFNIKNRKLELKNVTSDTTKVDILGHRCETLKFYEVFAGDTMLRAYDIFQYDKNALKVDASHFSNWRFGNFDKYIEEAGCLYLRFESDMLIGQEEPSRAIYEAVKIEETPIDPGIFSLDTSRVKKVEFN